MPAIRPPPAIGTTIVVVSGLSSKISSEIAPWPAWSTGSSNGWTNVAPVSSTNASRRWCASAGPSDSRSTSAPYPRHAAILIGFAVRHMKTRQAIPSSLAEKAAPAPAFPADHVTMPCAFSSDESDASFASMPRGLNEPVRWKSSALRCASAPIRADSARDEKSGVRWSRPPTASRAARTSSERDHVSEYEITSVSIRGRRRPRRASGDRPSP